MTRALPAALLLSTLLAPAASAGPFPTVIRVPDDFQPEGVAASGTSFFVGSLVDGDIYRGDLRTGRGSVFVDNTGRMALGLKVDTRHGLLLVAGGLQGSMQAYDLASGALRADVPLGAGLINDVAVTPDAAYLTNSFAPELYRVPIGEDGTFGAVQTIHVTGPAGAAPQGFGLNGIVVLPNGNLVVNYTDTGQLFTVDPATGASTAIPVTGGTLVPGTLDGLLLRGHQLWANENGANAVAILRLAPDWGSATITRLVTNSAFEFPTTVARHGNRVVVVNGKFDLGFPPPFGPGAPPGTHFEVVQVPSR